MTSSSESLKRRVEAVLDMAVSTVSSLSEAFTAGVPLQTEETQENGVKDKSGLPSSLPAIPEDGEESKDKDVSMTDAERSLVNGKGKSKGIPEVDGANGTNGTLGGEGDGEDGDDDEDDGEEDDAVLQVHD